MLVGWSAIIKQVIQMMMHEKKICAKMGPLKMSWTSAFNLKISFIADHRQKLLSARPEKLLVENDAFCDFAVVVALLPLKFIYPCSYFLHLLVGLINCSFHFSIFSCSDRFCSFKFMSDLKEKNQSHIFDKICPTFESWMPSRRTWLLIWAIIAEPNVSVEELKQALWLMP